MHDLSEILMNSEEKKAYLLLKSVIFYYHGSDDLEQKMLVETACSLQALDELAWVQKFIAIDFYTAFDRARSYLKDKTTNWDKPTRLEYLVNIWDANNKKGYISEMEALAFLKLAKDWQVEEFFIEAIKR